jgi:hypothetical protein
MRAPASISGSPGVEVPLEGLAVWVAPCIASAFILGGSVYFGPGPPGPGGLGRGLSAAGEEAITTDDVYHECGVVRLEVCRRLRSGW